jgi:hypothetical protein
MKHSLFFLTFLLLFSSSFAQVDPSKQFIFQVSENSLQANLKKIAGNEYQGRMAASNGDNLAAQYIAGWFNAHSLLKPFDNFTSYFQQVPLTDVSFPQSTLSVDGKPYALDQDWTCFLNARPFSAKNAEIVFAGYGLSLPAYDDFKDLDIKGKVILIETGTPTGPNGRSLIPEKELPDPVSAMNSILSKKPAGILFVSDEPVKQIARDTKEVKAFEPFLNLDDLYFPRIPGGIISRSLANNMIGGRIDSVFNIINFSGKPHSFNTHRHITLSVVEKDLKVVSPNIIGILKGAEPLLPCIVVTAHHDHEGIQNNKTYFGADDNGTGTVALMEIIKILGDAAAKGVRPKRTIIFISTAAEEQGLIGAWFYVTHPVMPMNKTYCNINMDMLGRVDSFYTKSKANNNYIYAMYNDAGGKVFNDQKLSVIDHASSQLNFDKRYAAQSRDLSYTSLISRSDSYPFMKQNIPAIWYFSGFHKDYHQPTDTPDRIDYPLLKKRTQLVLATVWKLANE